MPELKKPAIRSSVLVLLVCLLVLIGVILTIRFSDTEEQRELLHWQNKLNLIADSRSSDIDNWLTHYFHELTGVANNPSLQLYITTLQSGKAAPEANGEEPAQTVFLRNLLVVTADRLGFLSKTPDALKDIHANVHNVSGTGLAIVDNQGKILVSTEGLPLFDDGLAAKVAAIPRGQSGLIDIYALPNGELQMGFVLPIYPIQADATAEQQIGKLVAIKKVESDFFNILKQPGVTEKSLQATLLRKEDNNVVYLSPVMDGAAVATRFAVETNDLDAGFALLSPGSFAIKHDAQSHRVLMTSRTINHSPWTLMLTIERNEALADSDDWRVKMQYVLLAALLAFVASIVAAWWYGTSRRAILLSAQTAQLAAHSIAQEKLLRLITDNQPSPIFIADKNHIVRFANKKAADDFHLQSNDAVGKDLSALMGVAAAKIYMEKDKEALSAGATVTHLHRVDADKISVTYSEHLPLAHIPIETLPYPTPGVLVIKQDVTEIVTERERRTRTFRNLVDTLVEMMDKRDPNAANHSGNVAFIARALGEELLLAAELTDTAATAGKLMNIGKLLVPSTLLTKSSALGKDEMKTIQDSLFGSIQLLQHIEFDGPVVDTLKQAPEHFDGSGPLRLQGENILITARIIAVANSFVGMISKRSYRQAMPMEEATALLLQDNDRKFDRRIVIALVNFIENKNGRQRLLDLQASNA